MLLIDGNHCTQNVNRYDYINVSALNIYLMGAFCIDFLKIVQNLLEFVFILKFLTTMWYIYNR